VLKYSYVLLLGLIYVGPAELGGLGEPGVVVPGGVDGPGGLGVGGTGGTIGGVGGLTIGISSHKVEVESGLYNVGHFEVHVIS